MIPGVEVNTTTPYAYGVVDIGAIFEKIFNPSSAFGYTSFFSGLGSFWAVFSVIAIVLSLIFLVGFIYSKIRLTQMYEIMEQNVKDEEAMWAARHEAPDTRNARWDNIQQKVAENSPESWRIAIIEADIMLDETLTQAGYVGQSLGEKLKTANPQSFTTIQDAWEAHKVRNEIAHTGSDFVLTQKTAKETLLRFERVFKEFDVI